MYQCISCGIQQRVIVNVRSFNDVTSSISVLKLKQHKCGCLDPENIFSDIYPGDLTDISANKEALVTSVMLC